MPACQRCGEDNPERARFCLACGAALAAPAPRREERKRVSVLFCDLVGFTSRAERLDVEDVRGLLSSYYARLRIDLERYGATVEKFIGDAVMALFGAPSAHEDDPERAVRAALSIHQAIAAFNEADPTLDLHVRIGVTTGEALVAPDASPEAMASGDVVNTAARLQAAAPVDGILVDETTWRATERAIEYRPAAPVAAKGKVDPVPAWQVVAPRAGLGVDVADAPATPLVGRERRSQVAGERQYAFRHVLIRDVAYGQLPRAVRAGKHRRAAEWLELLSPDRAEDRAELLAHHWQAALAFARATGQDTTELSGRARLAVRDAGDRALGLNAFATAARWYAAALEHWPADDSERPRLLLQLRRARFWAEEASEQELTQARDGLLAQGDREAAAEAEALLSRLANRQGQGERVMEHAQRAVALLDDAGPSPAKVVALAGLARARTLRGEHAEAIRVGRQALAMAEALGLDEQRSFALDVLGIARVNGGDPGGIADLEHAVAVAEAANSPHSSVARLNLASSLIAFGELARGFELQAKARETAERFGLAGALGWLRAVRVSEDYWRGRWEHALADADQFIAESRDGTPHVMEDSCRLVRGRMRLARGELAGALEDATTSLKRAGLTKRPEILLPPLAFHAHVLLAAGRLGQAADQAGELLAWLAEQGAMPTNPDWSGDLATVLEALGRGSELLELAATVTTPIRWLQAAAAIAAGDFERAADRYAEIGSLPDEAYARLRAAERLLAAGRQAAGRAARARARLLPPGRRDRLPASS